MKYGFEGAPPLLQSPCTRNTYFCSLDEDVPPPSLRNKEIQLECVHTGGYELNHGQLGFRSESLGFTFPAFSTHLAAYSFAGKPALCGAPSSHHQNSDHKKSSRVLVADLKIAPEAVVVAL